MDRIGRVGPVGDLEDERVAPSDGTGRRRDELAGEDGLLVLGPLGRVDAVAERGVDDDGEVVGGMFGEESAHRFVELLQAGSDAAFGGDVRAVDDDVSR